MSAERVTPLEVVDAVHALRNRIVPLFRAVSSLPSHSDAGPGLGLAGEEIADRGFAELERLANALAAERRR